jgi:hypothetical protein
VIGGNPVQPCSELALTLERAQLGDDLDQHLLGQLFSIVRVENHPDCDVVNPRLVSQNQLLKRGTVAILGLFDQRGIRRMVLDNLAEWVERVRLP